MTARCRVRVLAKDEKKKAFDDEQIAQVAQSKSEDVVATSDSDCDIANGV